MQLCNFFVSFVPMEFTMWYDSGYIPIDQTYIDVPILCLHFFIVLFLYDKCIVFYLIFKSD